MSLKTTSRNPQRFVLHPLRTDLFNSFIIHKPTNLKTKFKQ